MKHKQWLLIIVLITSLSLVLLSCDEQTDVTNASTTEAIAQEKHDENPKLELQSPNSVVQEVKDSVAGLKERVSKLEASHSDFQSKVADATSSIDRINSRLKEQEKSGKWSIIIGWCLALISIVVAIISIIKANGLNRRMNRHRKEIDLLNQELNNVKLSLPTKNSYAKPGYSSTFSITRSQYDELLREINNLKLQLRPSSMPNHDYGYRPSAQDKPNTVSKKKEGYFSQVIKGGEDQGYFKKIQDSRDSDSRFSVVVDGNTAEFRPIVQVREITSSDAMDLAVDFKGVSKSEANSMTVATSGEAQLFGDKWVIKRKAIVILNK